VSVLNHDRQTRGFQLRDNTLCVVSSEGKGYVYDLSREQPTLLNEIDIEDGAVGHLDQGQLVVAYSLGGQGYHFYDKQSGAALGVLDPTKVTKTYFIRHPSNQLDCRLGVGSIGRASDAYPPQFPGKHRTMGLAVQESKRRAPTEIFSVPLHEDEWGAGMMDGDLFAGVSRAGRLFICSNWRKAVTKASNHEQVTLNLECDGDASTFDLGGWLAIRDHKIMFEVQDRAYIIGLEDDNTLKTYNEYPQRPSFEYATSSAAQLAVPVSFMGIYDDCVMSTYTVSSLSPIPNLISVPSNPIKSHQIPSNPIQSTPLTPINRPSATANASKSKPASQKRAPASCPPKSSASSASPQTSRTPKSTERSRMPPTGPTTAKSKDR
jgi:hypothetical protein